MTGDISTRGANRALSPKEIEYLYKGDDGLPIWIR